MKNEYWEKLVILSDDVIDSINGRVKEVVVPGLKGKHYELKLKEEDLLKIESFSSLFEDSDKMHEFETEYKNIRANTFVFYEILLDVMDELRLVNNFTKLIIENPGIENDFNESKAKLFGLLCNSTYSKLDATTMCYQVASSRLVNRNISDLELSEICETNTRKDVFKIYNSPDEANDFLSKKYENLLNLLRRKRNITEHIVSDAQFDREYREHNDHYRMTLNRMNYYIILSYLISYINYCDDLYINKFNNQKI